MLKSVRILHASKATLSKAPFGVLFESVVFRPSSNQLGLSCCLLKDGLHPYDKGYELMFNALRKYVV